MPKKLRVLFATEDFYPNFIGGQGVYGYHLVSELAKKDCDLTVLAEARPRRKEFWQGKRNVELVLVPFCFGNQLLLALFEYFYFMFRLSNRYFDIVHANQLSGLFFVLFMPRNVGCVVFTVHNTYKDLSNASSSLLKKLLYFLLMQLEQWTYEKADGLIFNTEVEKEGVVRCCDIQGKKITVVPLGVVKSSFSQEEKLQSYRQVRAQLGINKDNKIILYVGRLVKRKRIDTLLKALTIFAKEGIRVHGIIIGTGNERGKLENMAPKNVSFLGFVDNLKPYFLAADCFVTVSIAEGGVVLTALEAASFGLPLILSDEGASSGILVNGQNGYIVDPNDPKALADKIKKAFSSAQIGNESKKLASTFSWDKTAKKTINFYQLLLQKQ